MKLTGSQIFAKELKALGVNYVAGIPASGSWPLVEALATPGAGVPFIQVMQEQSAVHMADGYFRACGRPMAALLSTSPQRSRALSGIETASADGSALLVVTAGRPEDSVAVLFEPVDGQSGVSATRASADKTRLTVSSADKLSSTLRRAFDTMMSGPPRPVILEIPMAVQAESVEIKVLKGASRLPVADAVALDDTQLARVGERLAGARKPVILAGAGVIRAEASADVLNVAETFLCPVITTAQGKGAFPEDHPLSGGTLGRGAREGANTLLVSADVVIAMGCACDPDILHAAHQAPLKKVIEATLITLDDDPVGPAPQARALIDVAIVDGLRAQLRAVSAWITPSRLGDLKRRRARYRASVTLLRERQHAVAQADNGNDGVALPVQRPLIKLRQLLERDAILVVGAGNVQAAVRQVFPVYTPRSHLCAGRFGDVGWAVPAAIGAKLAMPARQVVCVVGDGDFLQSMQEVAVCVMHTIPVVFVVLNNSGYGAVSELHQARGEHYLGGEFNLPDGKPYSPDFASIARSFGLQAWRVEFASQLSAVFTKALNCPGPSLVEIITARASHLAHGG
ncbi:thiamine pyrophosphate-binding protein [Pseudomonas sp. NPDC088368]|uniref:thiamine pyrophosphate-binding protein n=1 Tax=Pseudomonas sp. NPDC088368 TaxID=3364453 RepID=UPI0037FCD9A8